MNTCTANLKGHEIQQKETQDMPNCLILGYSVGSVRLSFIVASSFSESRKRMAGEELSLFTANLNVKVVPERFVHSVRLTNKLIVVSIICVL